MENKTLIKKIFDALFTGGRVKNQFDFGEKLKYTSGYVSTIMKNDADLPQKVKSRLNSVFGISKEYLDSNGTIGTMFPSEIPLNNGEKDQENDQTLQSTKTELDMQLLEKLIDYIISDGKEKTQIIQTLSRKLPDTDTSKPNDNPLEMVG